jgi:glycosyltransferase involved in cell wall biosynthesis
MSDIPRVVICFPVRNEEKYLKSVLESLIKQTIPPVKIIIANDGSTDETENIAKSYEQVEIINREPRENSVVGKIDMAFVWNDSITPAKKYHEFEELDFIVFLGGDLVLPVDYVEKLVDKFTQNSNLRIAGGVMIGEFAYRTTGFMIPGGGRIMKYSYWLEIGGEYPAKQGWEAYPIYRAQNEGFDTQLFTDVEYYPLRPTGGRTDFNAYGQAMKAYGYFVPYAIGRALRQLLLKGKGIKVCIAMLKGYIFSKPVRYEKEIRKFVKNYQRRKIRKIIFRF